MGQYDDKALELHRKNKGKLEVPSKVPIKDKRGLSLAYTPPRIVPAIVKALEKFKN